MTELMHPEDGSHRRESKTSGRGAGVRAALTPLAIGLLSALAGCTAILETSKSQCNIDEDCVDLFAENSTHVCVQHVCERPFCSSDAECRSRGERFAKSICSADQQICVPAECTAPDECNQGQACDLKTNRCVARECTVTMNCLNFATESPTMECVNGFCVDEEWGCIGKPDDRERVPGEKGTLVFKIISAADNLPIPGADWRIWVCGAPQYDNTEIDEVTKLPKGCETNRAPHESATYDGVDGTVRITGLDPALPVRIWLDEQNIKDGSGKPAVIPMEFVSQKPPVGITTAPPVRAVAYAGLLKLIDSYKNSPGTTLRADQILRTSPDLASLYSIAYNCKDEPAELVSPSYRHINGNELPALGTDQNPLLVFYFDEGGLAYQSVMTEATKNPRLWTFPTGVFSSLNLPSATNLTIKTSLAVDDSPLRYRTIRDNFSTRLTTGRMTTIHFYPRDYSIKVAQ